MSYLNHLYLPGALTVWCAVVFALAALWGYSLVLRGDESGREFARRAYRFFALAIVLCAAVLLLLLARRDFRVEYVAQYSGLDLPWYYQLAAFWAGQKGSFLIWLLWGSLLGLPLCTAAGKRDEAPVMGVYLLTLMGLLFILVRENPFLMTGESPADGAGLNPLLQDNWMVIHPPIMFVGFALSAVPFAFAIAALARRDYERWAARAFPWALAGFLVLGTAILMGGYWAYKTLGWGGYWGWDPVENASLVPWLFLTALVHGLHMERAKGRYRRANLVLAVLAFLSVLYGTFLTRSGVLADFSVHSFVDLGISGWLIALMAFFIVLSAYLLATRLRQAPSQPSEDPFLSRGHFMILATITILCCALVVLAGTSAPLLTRFMDHPGQVGPSFYNRVNLPLALLIGFLLALVPYLTWQGTTPRALARKLLWPTAASVAAVVIAVFCGVRQPFHILFVLLAALALTSNLQKTIEKARAGGLRSAGGYLSHVGVGIILLGILASSAYDHGAKVTLERGVPQTVEDLTLTFLQSLPATAHQRERMEIAVERAGGESYLAYPRIFLNRRTQQLMVNPHIRSFALQDLYISPIEYNPGQPAGAERRIELRKGESARDGGLEIAFLGFDLNAEGNALAQMQKGGPVTIGALLAVNRPGRAERTGRVEGAAPTGGRQEIRPLYRFRPNGQVESPPLALPGGGTVILAGINASAGAVQLLVNDGNSAATAGAPARLSVDVTKKPLIALVWYGLYVVLAGGILAAFHRAKHMTIEA